MSDELHTYIEPEIEARITALVLGEASEFEVDELERLMEEKPELVIFRRRVEAMHELLGEAVHPRKGKKDEAWQLSGERREALFKTFSEVGESSCEGEAKGVRISKGGNQIRAFIAIAACVMFCFILFMMATPSFKRGEVAEFSSQEEGALLLGGSDGYLAVLPEEPASSATPLDTFEIGDSPVVGRLFRDKAKAPRFNKPKALSDEIASADPSPSTPLLSLGRIAAYNRRPSIPQQPARPVLGVDKEVDKSAIVGFGNGEDFGDGWGEVNLGGGFGGGGLEGVDPFGSTGKKAKTEVAKHDSSVFFRDYVGGGVVSEDFDGDGFADGHQLRDVERLRVRDLGGDGKSRELHDGVVQRDQWFDDSAGVVSENDDGLTLQMPVRGIRSGDTAVTRQSIDAILNNPDHATHSNKKGVANSFSRNSKNEAHWAYSDESTRGKVSLRFISPEPGTDGRQGLKGYDKSVSKGKGGSNYYGYFTHAALKNSGDGGGFLGEQIAGDLIGGELSNVVRGGFSRDLGAEVERHDLPLDEKKSELSLHWDADHSLDVNDHLTVPGETHEFLRPGEQNEIAGKAGDEKLKKAQAVLPPGSPLPGRLGGAMKHLADTNTALDEESKEKVDVIRNGLYRGKGLYHLGKYDEAESELKEVLRNDPYNKPARRWLERVAATKSEYYRAAYDETRSKLLKEVDEAWERAVPAEEAKPGAGRNGKKARQVVYRRIELQEADQALIVGRAFYHQKDYGKAAEHYQKALELLPDDPSTQGHRDSYRGHLADAKVALSVDSQRKGEVREAKKLLHDALKLDVENAAAKRQIKQLEQKIEIRKTREAIASPVVPKALPNETITAKTPFSTFSLNVSDVSFKLAKVALLEKGQWPDAAKVRTEEFVNAFDYGDSPPRRGESVTCAVEQSTHPFLQQRNLLRVGMKTASVGRSAPLRLTILLDNSGSMEREDREASVLAAIRVLASQLGPQDVISVVGFARQPRLLADRMTGDKAHKLVEIVANTPSEGGTNIEEALRLARVLAKRQHAKGAQDRVVLITDGIANLGSTVPEQLSKQIVAMRQEGIAFDACGVGAEGLNDDILEALTRQGDGRYYFLNRAEDADAGFAKQLAGALTPAAKNVKVQVKFNPKRVSKYRLLGFERHRLKKEDFRNDKVDAAEMAAEEAGNAVYQIQVNPQGEGELGEVFVRFLDVSTGRMVERSWPLPYEPQAAAFDVATPSMQLAGTAAMLGEKLHGTDAGSVRFPMISETLNKLGGHYAADTKVQDLIRMCRKVK